MAEASKPAGRDDNPCTLCVCSFTNDDDGDGERCHVWVSWKDMEARERFRGVGGGRVNLRVLMGREFMGVEWESMGEEFWEPLVWLGGEVVEEGCFVFGEVEGEDRGWGGWGWGNVRGWWGGRG